MQEWNEELGYMAQFWAGNCEYELNENRNSQSNTFTYVGQSMIATSSYSVNYTVLIGKWFSAGQYYNYYSGYCTDSDGDEDEDGDSCAGYTQVGQSLTSIIQVQHRFFFFVTQIRIFCVICSWCPPRPMLLDVGPIDVMSYEEVMITMRRLPFSLSATMDLGQ